MVKGHYGAWASLALLVAPCTQADEQLLGAGYLKSYGLWQDAVAPVSAEQWQWQNKCYCQWNSYCFKFNSYLC